MTRIFDRQANRSSSLHSGGLALVAICALPACADAARAETTASFYLGSSRAANSDVQISQPGTGSDATFHGVSWDTESSRAPRYYGVRVTHFLEDLPDWGIGFDFTHDKVLARTDEIVHVDGMWNGAPVNQDAPMSQRVQSFSITHGVNILALNLYHRWMNEPSDAFPHGRWQPYVGAGLTYYMLHSENTVNGQRNSEGYKSGGFGYQLLGGLQYSVTQTLGVFIEAKYNRGNVKVGVAGGGRGEAELVSSQLIAGVSVIF